MRSFPRFLENDAYLYDEGNFDLAGYLSSSAPEATPVASPAPAPAAATPVASPAPAPAAASGWTPWTSLEEKQIGDYYYLPQVQPGQASWEDPHAGGPTLTGLTRIKASDRSAFMDPHRQSPFDPYTSNFIPYELIDPATGQVIGGATKPEYTTGWQPGQAWDPGSTKPALVGGDLYMPGFDESGQLTGLTRFIGGKPAPGQVGQVEAYDPSTGKAIPGLGIQSYAPYKVDPSGGNTFFEALMGALPAMIPIGMAAMGAAGAAGAAGGAGAGIAEGMAPGVLTPASAAELAAVNSIVGAPLAGGADLYADLAGAELPSGTPTPDYVRTSADRAAQYGKEGYGPGMSGAQTSAYDKILELTGSKELADLGARAVGGASSIEDLIKNKVKDELKKEFKGQFNKSGAPAKEKKPSTDINALLAALAAMGAQEDTGEAPYQLAQIPVRSPFGLMYELGEKDMYGLRG